MPTSEERRLTLVKGTPTSGAVTPTRSVARRTVTRRMPPAKHPVEAILERLDEEPVDLAGPTEPVEPSEPIDPSEPATTGEPTGPSEPASAGEPATGDAAGTAEPGAGRRRLRLGLARRRLRIGLARRAPSRRPVVSSILTVALCAALATAGVFGHRWYQDRALEQAHQHALAAAKQTTVNFVSVSAASVDGDLQRITAGATGEFKEEFTRGQAQVRAAVVENKVESRGTVLRAGLLSGDRRSAVVLVAVDATVKNVNAPDGRPSHYRIQVDLTKDRGSGTWLVSRLQFVG
jgi:Mce-associated membrane protein